MFSFWKCEIPREILIPQDPSFGFPRWNFSGWPCLSWSSLCQPGWPRTQRSKCWDQRCAAPHHFSPLVVKGRDRWTDVCGWSVFILLGLQWPSCFCCPVHPWLADHVLPDAPLLVHLHLPRVSAGHRAPVTEKDRGSFLKSPLEALASRLREWSRLCTRSQAFSRPLV